MDGVLLETHGYTISAFNGVLAEYGLSLDDIADSYNQGFRGVSLRDILRAVKRQHDINIDLDDFTDKASAIGFSLMAKDKITADRDLIQFLDELASHKVKVGLGSASRRARVVRILDILDIIHYFDSVVTADDVSEHKPNPHVYLEVARQLQIPPHRCVVIEDAAVGVEAGKRAGMKVVGFLKYQEQKDSLSKADRLINDYSEMKYAVIDQLIRKAKGNKFKAQKHL